MERNAIITMPPYAPYLEDVLKNEFVCGIRFNTVMPIKESHEDVVLRLNEKAKKHGKKLWIDLKCRQLRVKNFGTPPYTEIVLSHPIKVFTPTKAYFSDRNTSATILEVDGNRLIMQDGPRRVVGPGESVTIPHPTLEIDGYFIDTDKKYIEASAKVGVHDYILSFVEKTEDIGELLKYDSKANIISKIESQKGLDYVERKFNNESRLMAARGDLYLELQWPHTIPEHLELILKKDKNAVVASRILDSLSSNPEPSSSDISDIDNLLRMGYKTLMLGDEVCMKKESLISAINILYLMATRYENQK